MARSLSEQIGTGTGRFLGNLPQGFSHIGGITSRVRVALRRAQTGH
jgi:GH15 family glucan-1,4-alpha-glucosidase